MKLKSENFTARSRVPHSGGCDDKSYSIHEGRFGGAYLIYHNCVLSTILCFTYETTLPMPEFFHNGRGYYFQESLRRLTTTGGLGSRGGREHALKCWNKKTAFASERARSRSIEYTTYKQLFLQDFFFEGERARPYSLCVSALCRLRHAGSSGTHRMRLVEITGARVAGGRRA